MIKRTYPKKNDLYVQALLKLKDENSYQQFENEVNAELANLYYNLGSA